ncbi:MAG: DUF5719 family protein [Acidimicrobiia bacterium]
MRTGRITSLVVLAGAIAAGLVYEASEPDERPQVEISVRPGVAMPTARAEPTLSSTWYCAGGTASEGGSADHVIVIANPTDTPRTASVTVLTGTVAAAPAAPEAEGEADETTTTAPTTTTTAAPTTTTAPPAVEQVEVPAHDRVELRLADVAEAQLAGAVVEVDGGEVAVEHQITGELGRATAPCSTTASPAWSFPWGVTTRGNRELMVFMNPFPDDATVDIAFATDEGVRDTARFQGFVVPGRSVVGAFIDQDVTRKAQVSAQVQVRGGRLVVDRIQMFDGTDGRRGMTLGLGVPSPAETWVFPAGETGDGLFEQLVVFNPEEEVAEVEVEVLLDDPGELGPPEPFELTVQPGRYASVDLHAEERVPPGVGHAVVVRSLNGVPVTVERVNAASEPAANEGISSVAGSPFLAPTWYFPAGGPSTEEGRDEVLVLLNLGDEDVTYDLTGFAGGQTIAVQDQQDQVLPAGGRAVIRLGDHIDREDLSVIVTASGPVVAERGLYRIGGLGLSQSLGIPSAEGIEVPEPGGL